MRDSSLLDPWHKTHGWWPKSLAIMWCTFPSQPAKVTLVYYSTLIPGCRSRIGEQTHIFAECTDRLRLIEVPANTYTEFKSRTPKIGSCQRQLQPLPGRSHNHALLPRQALPSRRSLHRMAHGQGGDSWCHTPGVQLRRLLLPEWEVRMSCQERCWQGPESNGDGHHMWVVLVLSFHILTKEILTPIFKQDWNNQPKL